MAQRKNALGKGLAELFADNSSELSAIMIKITEVEPNRNQPRSDFDPNALEELADSIKEVGIIQPLIVRPLADGGYQIVAGERRWRAAQIAGLTEVPAVVRSLTDKEVAELALIENLQREDLNSIEVAEGYRHLMEEYGMTQEQVAERVGKSRPAVANTVRLLELPDGVIDLLRKGSLSAGHGRALLSINGDMEKVRFAEMAAKRGLTVREIEKQIKKENDIFPKKERKQPSGRSSFLDEVEIALSEALGRRVKVSGTEEKGTLEVDFFSLEELADMAKRLAGENSSDPLR